MSNKKNYTFSLPPSLVVRLDNEASTKELSKSAIVRIAVDMYLDLAKKPI